MDKKDVSYIYIYTHTHTHTHTHTCMEYSSAIRRNKTGSFVVMWMDPQSVIQSEVRKKKKYCILTHLLTESRKKALLNLFAGHEWRLRRIEWICGCRAGRKGGVNWEIRIDIYTAMCETD